jgi:hypothetical protein
MAVAWGVTLGVSVDVGVTVEVRVGVLVGRAATVWVKPAAKVATAWVWICSGLSVGVASFCREHELINALTRRIVLKTYCLKLFLVAIFSFGLLYLKG